MEHRKKVKKHSSRIGKRTSADPKDKFFNHARYKDVWWVNKEVFMISMAFRASEITVVVFQLLLMDQRVCVKLLTFNKTKNAHFLRCPQDLTNIMILTCRKNRHKKTKKQIYTQQQRTETAYFVASIRNNCKTTV